MSRKKDINGLLETFRNREFDVSIRSKAAYELGNFNNPKVIENLMVQIMKNIDDEYTLQFTAATALGKIGLPVVDDTIEYLLQSPKERVRYLGIQIINSVQHPLVVTELISKLGDRSEMIRASCALALGSYNDEDVVNSLIEALEDSNSVVRENSAESLGKINNAIAITPLINLLNDDNKSVIKSAAEALEKIGDISVIEILKQKGLNDSSRQLKFNLLAKAKQSTYEIENDLNQLIEKQELGIVKDKDLEILKEDEIRLQEAKNIAELAGDDEVLAKVTALVEMIGNLRPISKTIIKDSVISRSNVGSDDMMNELERLGTMKEKGLLTDEQFESAKNKLLES